MNARWFFIFCLLTSASAKEIASEKGDIVSPILGSWTWTREENNCTETYTFNADGTEHVSSGNEILDSVYAISSTPSAKGFYKLTDRVLKDYGGKDCADDDTDSMDQESSSFVIFHPLGDMYLVCQTEAIEKCFGPLKRVKNF